MAPRILLFLYFSRFGCWEKSKWKCRVHVFFFCSSESSPQPNGSKNSESGRDAPIPIRNHWAPFGTSFQIVNFIHFTYSISQKHIDYLRWHLDTFSIFYLDTFWVFFLFWWYIHTHTHYALMKVSGFFFLYHFSVLELYFLIRTMFILLGCRMTMGTVAHLTWKKCTTRVWKHGRMINLLFLSIEFWLMDLWLLSLWFMKPAAIQWMNYYYKN